LCYENLRKDVMEQRKNSDGGWAMFMQKGMLAWSVISESFKKTNSEKNDFCYLKNSVQPGGHSPIVSILTSMIRYGYFEEEVNT
jgi:hypothetical protein